MTHLPTVMACCPCDQGGVRSMTQRAMEALAAVEQARALWLRRVA